MPNELPLPPDLQHLIEKRGESKRRQVQRRTGTKQETVSDTTADVESDAQLDTTEEEDRRTREGRRAEIRRQNDS